MAREFPLRIWVLQRPKDADEVGVWPSTPTLFIPVTRGTLPYLYGITDEVIDPFFFHGTPAEVDQALQTLLEQTSEPPLTLEDLLALYEFRVVRHDDGLLHLEARPEEEK